MTGESRQRRSRTGSDETIAADPYATLGLPTGAPVGDVKRAYRRLAKAFHPDSAGAAALPRFLAIHEAYERITTGRVLPGAARGASPSRGDGTAAAREPWRADPARARATRQGAAKARSNTRAGAAGASERARRTEAGDSAAREGASRERGGGRRAATRKATLGSTSYDDARDRADATWSGASWYGPTTGEYWIINPREYADPRKHGPAYQARIREAAAASAQPAAADIVVEEGPIGDGPGAGDPAATNAPPSPEASPPPSAARRRAGTAPLAAPASRERQAAGAERPRFTGETRPPGSTTGTTARVAMAPNDTATADDDASAARWPLLGGEADAPFRRLRLALVAWPPLGIAAGAGAADVTGCAVAAAACSGLDPLLPWLAQVLILALLMLLPPLARLLSFGTVAVLLALVPVTAFLLAFGAGGAAQAGFALGVLLALAWLAGVAYAAVSGARRASLSSPR